MTVALIAVRSIGAGGVAAATIAGQLTTAVVIDRLGILGLEKTPFTGTRVPAWSCCSPAPTWWSARAWPGRQAAG